MIEDLLINKILQTKSLAPMQEQGLTSAHFLTARAKIDFILNHFQTYGVVPDITTFLEQFSDFAVVEVSESDEYLAYRIKEAYLYKDVVPVLKNVQDLVRDDSVKAVQYLKEQVDRLLHENSVRVGRGSDIVAKSKQRYEEYKRRVEVRGLLGIPTGIKLLDELLHGFLEEDLVVIFARTNVGKSWILLYFLTVAWSLGYKVLLYSGEMSEDIVGFRFDTLYKNFSNMGLMNGSDNLGGSAVGDKSLDDYREYIEDLSTKEGFVVVTPKDFGGRNPVVDELRELMIYHKADILGVDQLSLLSDQRKGENTRIQYSNISKDLFRLSEDLRKPVLLVGQANRDSVKGKDKEEAPELHEFGESDGVVQNATRVISMVVMDNILKLAIKKNRYGLNKRDVLMNWNINHGILRPLLEGGQEQIDEYGF